MNTYGYVEGNPLSYTDLFGLAKKKNPNERLVNCPRKEMGECTNICANRGGVKSCAVTRSSRSTIIDGYPTKEPYTVPGSMNCVCNKPDGEKSFCSRNTGTCVIGGVCAAWALKPILLPIGGFILVTQ